MVRTVQKVFPEDSALILMLFTFRSAMNWTEDKDILLLKEMGGQGIFHYKAGSRERGAVWQVIASNLNCHKDFFEVTARGVRDRFSPSGTNQRLLENLKALELVEKNSQNTKY